MLILILILRRNISGRSRVLVRTVGDLITYINFINDVISTNSNICEKAILKSLSALIKVSVVRIKEWRKIYEKINNNVVNPDTLICELQKGSKKTERKKISDQKITVLESPSSSPFSISTSSSSEFSFASSSSSSSSSIDYFELLGRNLDFLFVD